MLITIDGPIATGKSTIAKSLAQKLGFIYFDTGAMYRSLTYGILKNNISPSDTAAIINYLDHFDFNVKVRHNERRYYVDGIDITDTIRGEEVTKNVSEVSAIKEVREKLVDLQREHSKGINAVFEGRDMGSVVFPHADLKIFLAGSTEVRAKRRYEELKKKYPEEYKDLTIEKTIKSINERDLYDSTREASPLKKADDACVIDTTDLTPDEVVSKILDYKDSKPSNLA